ncbi:uncharacterized protein BXZ73DRAFT_101217 [Epithele typhae]|uniref:uncharacterized protein n=1 Tax=Epithele typhae TaxID=378194 RepID=UPI0020072E7D|nr:uncharacterized protein BXZ73DRAFT_101217 [Epithele typhae]KAH9932675.1 hypothetical protein BXZ73DRAFT_101217 [Epithele typhae]
MSIRVLVWIKEDQGRLKFVDDMESLLYVVMYSALMWQPHHFPAVAVSRIVGYVFDQYTRIPALNVFNGGSGKIANARCRLRVYGHAFKSPAFAKWLSDMMAYHVPDSDDDKAYRGKWQNTEFIYNYWSDFLRLHSLERDNRVDNLAGYSEPPDPSPSTIARELFPATSSREHSDAEFHRRRETSESAAKALKRKRSRREVSQPSAPRRSFRIQEKEEARAQAQAQT